MSKRLYRFFDDARWAEQMMRGTLRFRTLAYYRDYEEQQVRGDDNEGTSVFRPEGGLDVNNQTQRRQFVEPDSAFESEVKAGEIFVCCLSRSKTALILQEFNAEAYVEITNVPEFCRRVQKALPGARFGGRLGHERIGHGVEYYDAGRPPEARWACPDLIACSKFDRYRWQEEFRLLFSMTDALTFQNVQLRLVRGKSARPIDTSLHHDRVVEAGDLSGIAAVKILRER
jgi:hypothetical protein